MVIGIAGSKGFIGSYLTRYIGSRHAGPVRLLLRNVSTAEDPSGAEITHGDLLSIADCNRFADGLDTVFYLAHCNTPVDSDLDQPNDALRNLIPLLNFIQAVQKAGRKPHIVYFSSGGALYRRRSGCVPFREEDVCEPASSYGIQKLAAEHYLRAAAEKGYLTCTVLRVGNAYGTLLPEHRMQGLIGVAVNNVLHDKPVRIFGSLQNVRDYVHLDDICAIAERAGHPPSQPFEVLNVGSGEGFCVGEILDIIAAASGRPLKVDRARGVAAGEWLTDWVVLDVSKAKRRFGWTPAIDLHAGIGAMMTAGPIEPLSKAMPA